MFLRRKKSKRNKGPRLVRLAKSGGKKLLKGLGIRKERDDRQRLVEGARPFTTLGFEQTGFGRLSAVSLTASFFLYSQTVEEESVPIDLGIHMFHSKNVKKGGAAVYLAQRRAWAIL
jgi:hypothetical protein